MEKGSSVAGKDPAMRHAGEDAMAEAVGGGAADAPLPDDEEKLAGVIDSLRAVAAASHMVVERGQLLIFHLIVEEQEQNFTDLFTVHLPFLRSPGTYSTLCD
jgi:hypothetical protein